MAKIVTIANTKGGTGKSTVTILLASCISIEEKKRVLVIDCDTQNSIASLRELEADENDKVPFFIESLAPRFVGDYIRLYGDNYDFIFLDLPRMTNYSQDDIIYQLITFCDFLFIPVIAGQLDALSTIAFLDGVKEISSFKKDKNIFFKVRGFLNRKDRRKDNSKIIELMKSNGLKMLKESIPQLKIFTEVSTIGSILATKAGKKRFFPFYKEIRKQLRY